MKGWWMLTDNRQYEVFLQFRGRKNLTRRAVPDCQDYRGLARPSHVSDNNYQLMYSHAAFTLRQGQHRICRFPSAFMPPSAIPTEQMKAKREHVVHLLPQALEFLDVMKPISAHRGHVFPCRNNPKQPMNSQTANAALKRIG